MAFSQTDFTTDTGTEYKTKIDDNFAELFHEFSVVELGGDFDAGQEVRCERIGKWVTITSLGILSHSSDNNVSAGAGIIPSAYRPSHNIQNIYHCSSDGVAGVGVNSSGVLNCFYLNSLDGGGFGIQSRTSTGAAFSISYLIT